MNSNQLGSMLRKMYETAPQGERTTAIHMFGIKYADEIAASESTATDVIRASGIQPSYLTELHKGIRLARHVVLRDDL